MLQPCGGTNLGEKTFGTECSAKVGVQHLDGHVAFVLDVVGEVHGGHAAGSELALDAIAVGERGPERVETH
jgi:hypothetical protein